jgi:hypothetical protein
MISEVAAAAKLTVVAVVFTRLNVVLGVVRLVVNAGLVALRPLIVVIVFTDPVVPIFIAGFVPVEVFVVPMLIVESPVD